MGYRRILVDHTNFDQSLMSVLLIIKNVSVITHFWAMCPEGYLKGSCQYGIEYFLKINGDNYLTGVLEKIEKCVEFSLGK